jgi:hypothetical protein
MSLLSSSPGRLAQRSSIYRAVAEPQHYRATVRAGRIGGRTFLAEHELYAQYAQDAECKTRGALETQYARTVSGPLTSWWRDAITAHSPIYVERV